MTTTEHRPSLPPDRHDERVANRESISGAITAFIERTRAGDLGALPVVAGLIIIWGIFQAINSVFLSSTNLVNLAIEMCPVGVIALGIVVVLLVGQIDLSVGSMSGLSAAILAVLFVNHHLPVVLAIGLSILAGTATGFIYGFIFDRFGVPSFIATLAGLLALLGLQLRLLGKRGAINIPFQSWPVKFASLDFVPKWLSYVLVVVAAGAFFASGVSLARARRVAGLASKSVRLLAVQAVILLAILAFAVWYLNRTRGVGWMVVFFVALVVILGYVLTRTKFGRSFYAVGGNAEAARRAGIKVQRIYLSAFVLCSTLAAIGGILEASRLAAANQSTGTGDVNLDAIAAAVIGGTSLFGGRGTAYSALLGILVIQSISNGLTLLNLSSSLRFFITGMVLLLAVALDSVARKSRASHGRA